MGNIFKSIGKAAGAVAGFAMGGPIGAFIGHSIQGNISEGKKAKNFMRESERAMNAHYNEYSSRLKEAQNRQNVLMQHQQKKNAVAASRYARGRMSEGIFKHNDDWGNLGNLK